MSAFAPFSFSPLFSRQTLFWDWRCFSNVARCVSVCVLRLHVCFGRVAGLCLRIPGSVLLAEKAAKWVRQQEANTSQHVGVNRARNIKLSPMCVCVCACLWIKVWAFVFASPWLLIRAPYYSCHVCAVCWQICRSCFAARFRPWSNMLRSYGTHWRHSVADRWRAIKNGSVKSLVSERSDFAYSLSR